MDLRWFLVLLLCASSAALAATSKKIYRWKDENGNWVFSDVPRKGAEEMRLQHNSLNMPQEDISVLDVVEPPKAINYSVAITSPTNEQTIRENTGSLYVTGRIEPRFMPNMQVQLFLNGQAASEKQNSAAFALRDIPRGEHSLQIKLYDETGKMIAVSKPSVFFLHRATSIKKS